VLYLKRASKVIGSYQLSKGGITGTIADVRLILYVALKTLAKGLILAHITHQENYSILTKRSPSSTGILVVISNFKQKAISSSMPNFFKRSLCEVFLRYKPKSRLARL